MTPFRCDILSLFPGLFEGFVRESLIGRAIAAGRLEIALHDWREQAADKHRTVDDAPFGGGAGMVLKPEPLVARLRRVRDAAPGQPVVMLTPAGRPFDQASARRWARGSGLTLLCGRYEGFDARVEEHVDELVSLGDYVLNGGEVAAMAIVESVARLLPGVLGNADSVASESHGEGLLEYPHYTRPRDFEGRPVPAVLLSGDHGAVARWRHEQALARTRRRRPDLLVAREGPENPAGTRADQAPSGRPIRPCDSARRERANRAEAGPRDSPSGTRRRVGEASGKAGLSRSWGVQLPRWRSPPGPAFPVFAALVHHPVLNRRGEVGTTALTNVDLHDIARSAATYGVERVFVVTPVTLQRRMVGEIVGHWTVGAGASFNPRRAEALRRVDVQESVDAACDAIAERTGSSPRLVVTSARRGRTDLSYADLRARLLELDRPLLILFGTGWGMAEELMARADWRLPAIVREPALGAHDGYNHLSVRAAAAVVLDRLLGGVPDPERPIDR